MFGLTAFLFGAKTLLATLLAMPLLFYNVLSKGNRINCSLHFLELLRKSSHSRTHTHTADPLSIETVVVFGAQQKNYTTTIYAVCRLPSPDDDHK